MFQSPLEGRTMSTYMPKPGEVKAEWYVVDATDQVLGRLAAKIAMIVQGKNKPTYTPHVDTGDFVIVLNAEKVRVTGKKADVIEYDTYSRYPGGRHLYSYKTMQELHPEKIAGAGRAPNAPQEQDGPRHSCQGEDLQGRQASARRPAAQGIEAGALSFAESESTIMGK